jgi:hypothetical protein
MKDENCLFLHPSAFILHPLRGAARSTRTSGATPMIQEDLKVGGIYSFYSGENKYGVAKILALDSDAVHVALYKNKYDSRPESVDLDTLTFGTIHDADGFGMAHLPLAHETFVSWQPIFICQASVSEEDLEGYNYWLDDRGGVWQ